MSHRLSKYYINNLEQIINMGYSLNKCELIKVNNNLTCYISINNSNYKLFLKGVPKITILKNYLKHLFLINNIYVKIIEEKGDETKINILGVLYIDKIININNLLVKRYRYLQKKYIYEKVYNRSKISSHYRLKLNTIIEEKEEKEDEEKEEKEEESSSEILSESYSEILSDSSSEILK